MIVLNAILSVVVYSYAAIFTLALFPVILFVFVVTRRHILIEWVAKWWLTFVLRGVFFPRVRVTGREHIMPDRSYLILSNHQSFIDIPVLAASIPLRFAWLAKESLFKIPVIGWSMSMAGFIPIRREKKRDAMRSLKRVATALEEGRSVLIFPEGTRSYSNRLLPFKRGGVSVLAQTTARILPVTISGSYNAMNPKTFLINFGKRIRVHIHPPIETDHCLNKPEQLALLDSLRRQMEDSIQGMGREGSHE